MRYTLRAFGIGVFCALLFLLGQVATNTTLAQLPATSPGGTFNILSDAMAMAFNSDSAGTRNWFLKPMPITPPVTANWTNLGSGCTVATGSYYINVIGSTGSVNLCGSQRTVSAGDFSYTFVIFGGVPAFGGAGNPSYQLGFTDGTKFESICAIYNTAGAPLLTFVKNNTLTSNSYATANGAALNNGQIVGNLVMLRLRRTGTALSGDFSINNGLTFVNGFSDSTPFLTASALFVGADPRGANDPSYVTLVSSTLP